MKFGDYYRSIAEKAVAEGRAFVAYPANPRASLGNPKLPKGWRNDLRCRLLLKKFHRGLEDVAALEEFHAAREEFFADDAEGPAHVRYTVRDVKTGTVVEGERHDLLEPT